MSLSEDSAIRQAIPLVNKIQDFFARSGQAIAFDLPQIVVVGSQSVGKSSVLEGFVGREFLPRGSGIVTRRPLVLQLVKTKEGGDEFGMFTHTEEKEFYDFSEIRREIEAETAREAGEGKFISSVPINLKIFSPHVVDLTLVDLPGLTRVPVGDQPENIEEIVRNMIMSFIEKENCLILAVTPANTDLATSDAIMLAQKVDPKGKRTIGVLSKLDLMDQGTDAQEILENKVLYLERGYIGVVNRSQKDIQNGKDLSSALESEREFLESHPAYQHIATVQGTDYLRKFLNMELTEHIRIKMPELQGRIVKEALWLEAELKQFHKKPENLAEFTKLATAVKNDVEREFQKQMGDVSSRLDTVELEKRCVGSLIRGLFETTFRRDIELSSAIDDIQIRYKILMAKENTNGVRDSMFTSAKVLETIVEEQVSRLSLPIENIVSTVVDQLEGTISNLIRSLPRMGQFPVLQRFACAKSIEELQRNKEKALDFINLRILIEKGYVGTKQRLIQDHYDKEDKVVWQKDDGKASYENRIYRKIRLERDQLRLEEPHHAEHDDEREKSIDLRECTVRIYHNDHKKVELIHHRHNSEPNYVSFDMDGEDVQKLISKFCRVGFYPKLEDGGRVERDEEELKRAEDQDIRQVEVVYDMIREYMDVVIRSIWSDVMKTVITLIINQQVVFFKSDFLSDLINEGMKLTEESADAARNREAKQKRYQLCKGILGITKQLMHQTE